MEKGQYSEQQSLGFTSGYYQVVDITNIPNFNQYDCAMFES